MPTVDQEIEALVAERKGQWATLFRNDPAKAAELMKSYGVPSVGESMLQGAEQGVAHGFADDIERATSGGVAKNQIRAQAAHPVEYALSTLGGTAAAGGLLRLGTSAAAGKMAE